MSQNIDEWNCDEQFNEQIDNKNINQLNSSILNKSCIHTVNLMSLMLRNLPVINNYTSVQKLNISNNYLKQIPITFLSLKELIANKNCIQNIPQGIQQISCLRIMKLNHNKITIIPYLRYIVELQLISNPIKLVFSKIAQSNIKSLIFDWIQFLISNNSNQNLKFIEFITMTKKINYKNHWDKEYFSFQQIYEVSKDNFTPNRIGSLLHHAITNNHQFFINYLKSYAFNADHSINFNELSILGKLVLEIALESDNIEYIKLFMLKRQNINKYQTFWSNLELACQYSNVKFFDYLMSRRIKKLNVRQKAQILLEKLLLNFNIIRGSHYIMHQIFKTSKTSQNKKIKIILSNNYTYRQSENMAKGLVYLLKTPQLSSLVQFDQRKTYLQQEPLLHFASNTKNVELIYLLFKFKMSPFSRNKRGVTPKMSKGSAIGRKTLWKIQKKIITQKFNRNCSVNSQEYQKNQNNLQKSKKQKNLLSSNSLLINIDFKCQQNILSFQNIKIPNQLKIHYSDRKISNQQQQFQYFQQIANENANQIEQKQINHSNFKLSEFQDEKQLPIIQKSNYLKKISNIIEQYEQFHKLLNQQQQNKSRNQKEIENQQGIIHSPFKFCQEIPTQVNIIYVPRRLKVKRKIALSGR